MNASWKYTIPIARAEEREDGLYIVGLASGTERDTHGTEMAPEAISDFQRQITERASAGDPLPYKDSHGRGGGVLQDLGWITDAWVTPEMRLGIEVKLDDTNPAAVWLHGAIQRGKQYGMSVAGEVLDWKHVDVAGKRVLRFLKVALSEISNTTRPSWVPSFGTILARSIDGESGDNEMSEDIQPVEAAVENTDEQTTDEPVETSAVELSADAVEETVESETEIERALSKKDKELLLVSFNSLRDQMIALGVLAEESEDAPETTPESPDDEPDASRESDTSDTGEIERTDLVEFAGFQISREMAESLTEYVAAEVARAVEPLQSTIAEKDAYITELESMPPGQTPRKVAREKFSSNEDEFAAAIERIKELPADEQLRVALSAVYAGR